MVLGLRTKTKKDAAFHVDFNILIQEISPWPPSESLKSLRSVVLFWENGERSSGKTNTIAPSIGSGSTVGKIEFNEFISIQAVFQKEGSSKSGKWQKNLLELSLYEPRRDKLKGQHLGIATLDLAEHAMFHEDTSVPVPLNSKRSLKNNAQPMVYLRIQPLDGDTSSVSSRDALSKEASVDKDSKELMSATMSEEYTEDTEFASFTDDDEEEAPYPYHLDGNVHTASNRSQDSLKSRLARIQPPPCRIRLAVVAVRSSADVSHHSRSLWSPSLIGHRLRIFLPRPPPPHVDRRSGHWLFLLAAASRWSPPLPFSLSEGAARRGRASPAISTAGKPGSGLSAAGSSLPSVGFDALRAVAASPLCARSPAPVPTPASAFAPGSSSSPRRRPGSSPLCRLLAAK